ncbi:hypothetical protein S40288_07079 [Stachybotrys chartarum IBT 40288]|nr:hypothetical protein S40288_07079 [Stachybotrys chartarum IBT 40288]
MLPLKVNQFMLWIATLLSLAAFTQARAISAATRELAGVTVVDSPLVRSAETYAQQHSSFAVYKHVMRSWLYGVLMINMNQTLSDNIDLEVHAVSTLLHDLGWDQDVNSTVVSTDRRFEVDGAIAARDFIRGHGNKNKWNERRVQLVWDAIALHTERSIAFYKELDVQVVSQGIQMDFFGPSYGVTETQYARVEALFPKNDLRSSVNETLVWLCATKPATTYGKPEPIVWHNYSTDNQARYLAPTVG